MNKINEPKESVILEIKALTMTKNIARQLILETGISKATWDKLENGEFKILGWTWADEIGKPADYVKLLLVEFGPGDYRWVKWHNELKVQGVKQIIIK